MAATKCTEIPARYTDGWLEKLDNRTTIARAIQERLSQLETDLGGRETLSYQKRSLCKRAIWVEACIEQLEQKLARGESIDMSRLPYLINSLIGLFRMLGLERAQKRVPRIHERWAADASD